MSDSQVVSLTFCESQPQNFIFSTDIWEKIISNLDGSSFRSLCSTCKYFYEKQIEIKENRLNYKFLSSKYDIITLDEIEIVSSGGSDINEIKPSGYMESLKLFIDKDFPVKKIILRQALKSCARKPILSKFILSKILYCYITDFSIEYNRITWNDYLMLTASTNVTKLSLEGVDIIDSNSNEQVSVDRILSRIPKADEIHIQPCRFEPVTNVNLLKLNRLRSILTLNFVDISGDFDSQAFYSFLKKSLSKDAFIMIHFAYNEITSKAIEDAMKKLKELCKNEKWDTKFHMDKKKFQLLV